jgi:RHS repeat-associated protein
MTFLRRALAPFLAITLVAGSGNLPAYAATHNIVLPAAQVIILPEAACVPCVITDGVVSIISGVRMFFQANSPGIAGMPVYNSANLAPSVWGLGWISDMDHYAAIDAGGSVTVVGGSGARLKFTKTGTSGGVPTYRGPLGTFLTLTATVGAGGAVTSLTEKDGDGTSLLFAAPTPAVVGGEPLAPGAVTALRLTRLSDRNGSTIDYKRDSQGRLNKVVDIHGRYFTMTYNPAGKVATLADSGGRSVSFSYDAQGRKTSETGPEGTTSYAYDAAHHLTRITYPNGGVRNVGYDAQGRMTSQDDGDGINAVTYTRNPASTVVTDALGKQTTYEFIKRRGFSVITKVTDASGHSATFAYDSNLNLMSATDELGQTTTFTYDAQGNPATVTDAAGNVGRIAYEAAFNQPVSLTNPLGRKTTLSYDAKGNLIKISDPLNNALALTYDGFGHPVTAKNALGNTTSIIYDAKGAPASATDELGRTVAMERDALSRPTALIDPRGNRTAFTYDDAGNILQLKDALNGVTSMGYVQGRTGRLPNSITDAKGHATTINYDDHGRVTSVRNALGQTTSIGYNALGAPVSAQTRNGHTLAIGYDDLHRVTSLTLPEGSVGMSYNAVGGLVSASHYNGTALGVTYDALKRPSRVVQILPNGFAYGVDYSYDANGNRKTMKTPQGVFKYDYDALDRVTSVTNPFGQTVAFTYDALSRRKTMIYPNGTVTSYAYDAAGRVTQVSHKRAADQNVLAFNSYGYDDNGNATSITDAEGAHGYAYDALNRLTAATHPAGTTLPVANETFSYDAIGNRTADAQRSGYTYDAANRLVSDSSFTYTYDPDGNLTSRTDLVSGSSTTYTYNSSDQLIKVDASTYTIAAYKYDMLGNRVEKSVGGVVTRYVYDGPNVLAVLDGNNNLLSLMTQGPGIDAPMIARSNGTDYFYHEDALGSVTTLTDNTGQKIETVQYQAFGRGVVKGANGQVHAGSTVGNQFLFAARELDAETGLYFNRARYLDVDIGRFTKEDPIPGVNQYSYALSNPTGLKDPLGLIYTNTQISFGLVYGTTIGIIHDHDTGKNYFSVGTGFMFPSLHAMWHPELILATMKGAPLALLGGSMTWGFSETLSEGGGWNLSGVQGPGGMHDFSGLTNFGTAFNINWDGSPNSDPSIELGGGFNRGYFGGYQGTILLTRDWGEVFRNLYRYWGSSGVLAPKCNDDIIIKGMGPK